MRRYTRFYKRGVANSQGFTIIELMIATLVFSTILILLTFSVIAISQHYYKGIVQSETQNTSRAIMATLTQNIQFGSVSGSAPFVNTSGGTSWFCINNQIFVYKLGQEVVSGTPNSSQDQVNHGFLQATISGACPSASTIVFNNDGLTIGGEDATNETELLGLNMRLSQLLLARIAGTNLIRITLQVTYGADDLLQSASNNGPTATDVSCKDSTGFQFCAFSRLTTVTQPRVTGT